MDLNKPRYLSAQNNDLENPLFWKLALNQSDLFSYNTAIEGKGGPFGAQLWLINQKTHQYVLIGNAQQAEDSNAVISKGRASAHAESENLSPEKRLLVTQFLEQHKGEGWQIVQVSSSESCPSCRSKQIIFANELIQKNLIAQKDFHVVFKATYQQARKDALFNDAPYDQAFRAIYKLGILDEDSGFGILNLREKLLNDEIIKKEVIAGNIYFNSVDVISREQLSDDICKVFENADTIPTAVVINKDGSILSVGHDTRDINTDKINYPEKTAIMQALYQASETLRNNGKFASWDLDEALIYTNIRTIGPLSYSETLWYNLSSIKVVEEFTDDEIDKKSQEVIGIENSDLFLEVCVDYDNPIVPLKVMFSGDENESNVAHLFWRAKKRMEDLKNIQAEYLQTLNDSDIRSELSYIDGTKLNIDEFIISCSKNSHYNGKK